MYPKFTHTFKHKFFTIYLNTNVTGYQENMSKQLIFIWSLYIYRFIKEEEGFSKCHRGKVKTCRFPNLRMMKS